MSTQSYKRRSSTHNTLTDCSGYKRTQVAGRWRPKVVPKAKHATVPCGLYGMRRCALDREQVIDLAKLCLLVERGHACVGDQKLLSRFVWRNRPRLEAEAAAGARRGPAWVRPVGGPIERKPGGLACGEPPSLKHSGRKPGWPPARVVERWQASCSTERRAGGAHCSLALRAAAQVEAAPIDRAHYTALGSKAIGKSVSQYLRPWMPITVKVGRRCAHAMHMQNMHMHVQICAHAHMDTWISTTSDVVYAWVPS